MRLHEAIGKRLYDLTIEYGMTYYQLSKISGIPQTTIKDIASGRSKSTGIKNHEKISISFGINIRDFFNDEVFDCLTE